MKSVGAINIERLKRMDRYRLKGVTAVLAGIQDEILKIQSSYEGKLHTKLDRVILDLNDAMADLSEMAGIGRDGSG